MTKQENYKIYRKLFYQKWGTYENYLKHKKKKVKPKKDRDILYLKVRGDELWISPAGIKKEFFLTCGKTTIKTIRNFS